jgi:hypothetical protein
MLACRCQALPAADEIYRPKNSLMSVSLMGPDTLDYKDEIIEATDFWNAVITSDLELMTFQHGVNTIDLTEGEFCLIFYFVLI